MRSRSDSCTSVTVGVLFVAVVPAIIDTVTLHLVGDASAVTTGELLSGSAALAKRRNERRTFDFVATNGLPRNTAPVAALDFGFRVTKERFRRAKEFLFVAVVAAVVKTVTNVVNRDAITVVALM